MLADFYFSICMGHDRRTQDAVLSILRTLRSGGAGGHDPAIALIELEKCDIWTKVYAIPHLLQAMDSDGLRSEDRECAKRMVFTIGGGDNLVSPWQELIEHVHSRADEDVLSRDFESCASLLMSADRLPPSGIPYMDLPSQALSVILLGALAQVVAKQGQATVKELLQADSATKRTASAALANRHGRLSLRLAAASFRSAGFRVPQDQLERSCSRAGVPHLEPDLATILHEAAVDEAADDDHALRRLLVQKQAPAIAQRGRLRQVLERLRISPGESSAETLAKGKEIALLLRRAIQAARAIDLERHEFVFRMLELGLPNGEAPFWFRIQDTEPELMVYEIRPESAAWFIAGICGAIVNWLDRRPSQSIHPAAWVFAAQCADLLFPQVSKAHNHSPWPGPAISTILERVAGSRMDVRQVVQYLRGLRTPLHVQRLRPRVAVQLVRWLSQATWRATAARHESRWLQSAADVCEFAREQFNTPKSLHVVDEDEVTDAACVDYLVAGRSIDPWLAILEEPDPACWPASPSGLLLPLRQTEDDWYVQKKLRDNYSLYIAAGRCVHYQPGTGRDPWPDWDNHFATTSVRGFDGLFRLQMISFLRLDCFSIERRCRIVETLLADDWAFQIDRVMEKVLASDDLPAVSDHAHQVLVSRIESETQRARHRDYPLAVELEQDRRDAVQACIDWLARLMSRADHPDWIARFAERRCAARMQHSPLHRTLDCVVEHLAGEPVLVTGLVESARRSLQVQGASFDVERQRALVVAAVLNVPADVDWGMQDSSAFPARERRRVGMVETVTATPPKWTATISFGRLGRCDVTLKLRPAWEPGALVVAALRRGVDGQPVVTGEPQPVALEIREGDLEEVELGPKRGAGKTAQFSVRFASRKFASLDPSTRGDFDSQAWQSQPDTTVLSPAKRWARFKREMWRPHVEDRLALLCSMAVLPDRQAILAWTGECVAAAGGGIAHVLEAGGGLFYAVETRDFTPPSRERIQSLLANSEGADAEGVPGELVEGALLHLRLAGDGEAGLLELLAISDDRIRFNNQYGEGDLVEVHLEPPGTYFVSRQPTSQSDRRTQQIQVLWRDKPPPERKRSAMVVGWNPGVPVLTVEKAPVHSAGRTERWIDGTMAWLDLRKGDELQARVLPPRFDLGDKNLCVIDDGFEIEVPSEAWWGWRRPEFRERPSRECRVTAIGKEWVPMPEYRDLRVLSATHEVDLADPAVDGAEGIICSVEKGNTVSVWSVVVRAQQPARVVDLSVAVHGYGPKALRVGDKIKLRHADDSCVVSVFRRRLTASPVWKVERVPALPDAATGFPVLIQRQHFMAVQVGHDKLLVADGAPDSLEPQLYEGEFKFVGWPFENTINQSRQRLRRIKARSSKGDSHIGNSTDPNVHPGRYRWAISDELVPVHGLASGFFLMRMFRGAVPLGPDNKVEEPITPEQAEQRKLQEHLEELISDEEPVSVQFDSGQLRLLTEKLPAAQQMSRRNCVPIDEEAGRKEKQSPHVSYSTEVRRRSGLAILRRASATGSVVASTLRVPSLDSVKDWIDRLKDGGVLASDPQSGKEVHLKAWSLFYIGPENADPVTSIRYPDGLRYRFEWAPGCCLALPARALKFNGQDFAPTARQLFFGDAVRHVAFVDKDDEWVVDIREFGVARSESHRLYQQASRWHIVHLLQVSRTERGDFSIVDIKGVDEDSFESRTRSYGPTATLKHSTAERLDAVLPKGATGWIHGRLDRTRYVRRGGKELRFDPVWLALGRDGLQGHERVFLTAGRIEVWPNDCYLSLSAPEGLIGPSAPLKPMGRRAFSARTELLGRLGLENEDALAGSRYLVRLSAQDYGGEMRPSIIDPGSERLAEVPARRETDLRGWLRLEAEPPLVTILEDDPGRDTVFEVRPGVFATAGAGRVRTAADRPMQFGSVLRLRLDGADIIAIPAMPSDRDLIPATGRAVTLLPMPPRGFSAQGTNAKPDPWQVVRATRYTVEGLPSAVAEFSPPREGGMLRSMVDLMHHSHPRPAWVGPSDSGKLLVNPWLDRRSAAVFLETFISNAVLTDWHSGKSLNMPWPLLTFKDRPSATVIDSAIARKWRPHDRRTWTFEKTGETRYSDVPSDNATRALLMAEVCEGECRLRYSSEAMSHFVFPPRELASMLPTKAADAWAVTIAGVDETRRWMLVEVAPGRVYVLPTVLLVAQTEHGTDEAELTSLALECFGPGDEIEICRALGNSPEDVDRVRMVNWTPGTRSALGGRTMALRFQEIDKVRGGCSFGSGEYVLTLPGTEIAAANAGPTLIYPDNEIDSRVNLRLDDAGALLLERKDDGVLEIDGLPGYECWPDRDEYDWNEDKVGRAFFKYMGNTPPVAGPALVAAGGALPVTITFADHGRRFVRFTRRRQYRDKIEGICPFRVLGFIDAGAFLLRFGSHLKFARIPTFVRGLSESFKHREALLKALSGLTELLWARLLEDGGLLPGLSEPRAPGDDGTWMPLCMVIGDDTVLGLLCQCNRSRALHWLAIEQLAWADLSGHPEVVKALVIDPRKALRGRVLQSGEITVIGHPLAESEFEGAQPGSMMMVRDVGMALSDARRIVRSAASDVMLTLSESLNEGAVEEKVVVRMRDRALRLLQAEKFAPNKLWLDVGPAAEMVEVKARIEKILALDDAPATRKRAIDLFHDLVLRAWRHWARELMVVTPRGGNFGPWMLDKQLRGILLGKAFPEPNTEDMLRNFCRNVELAEQGGDHSLLHLAAAYRAVAGDLSLFAVPAMAAATTASAITELGRLCPPGLGTHRLPNAVLDGLARLLAQLENEESTLDFGPPLPRLQ